LFVALKRTKNGLGGESQSISIKSRLLLISIMADDKMDATAEGKPAATKCIVPLGDEEVY
jgi:hypothetical protein